MDNFDSVMNVIAAIAVVAAVLGLALLFLALGILAVKVALRFGRPKIGPPLDEPSRREIV